MKSPLCKYFLITALAYQLKTVNNAMLCFTLIKNSTESYLFIEMLLVLYEQQVCEEETLHLYTVSLIIDEFISACPGTYNLTSLSSCQGTAQWGKQHAFTLIFYLLPKSNLLHACVLLVIKQSCLFRHLSLLPSNLMESY